MRNAAAVAIQINSPGGSPVQSALIYKRIRSLAEEKGLKVYVFAEDVAASGGYLLALAGDAIYADASSIVGSIGVISASFGLNEFINKLGIQRRVITAGANKDILDPFLPEKPEDVERVKSIQADVHAEFIALVKSRRGKKIEAAGDSLFTGEFWSGKKAVELGLIDGLADLRGKMRELYGEDVRFKLVTPERSWFRRKLAFPLASGRSDLALQLQASPTILFRLWRHARSGRALDYRAMPQVLFLAAVAAGLMVARRWYTKERMRIAAELKRAKEAMERRDADSIVALERDPLSGIYRPKQG